MYFFKWLSTPHVFTELSLPERASVTFLKPLLANFSQSQPIKKESCRFNLGLFKIALNKY